MMDADDPILRNPERVAEIAIRAFARAKAEAIAENDRRGIPSYGTDAAGRIAVRRYGVTRPIDDDGGL